MESNQVKIRRTFSPNPTAKENYTLFCHSHAVRTTVTAKPPVDRSWIYAVRHRHRFQLRKGRLVVGLGVQWDPDRYNVASTLQLCVGRQCLIFQLEYAARSPEALRRFLSDADVIFVGVGNYRDEKLLAVSNHRLSVSRLVDLRHVASDLTGLARNASMETMADEILGMPGMAKEEWVGRSYWSDEWLSEDQVSYASCDAFIAFLIGKVLKVWKHEDFLLFNIQRLKKVSRNKNGGPN